MFYSIHTVFFRAHNKRRFAFPLAPIFAFPSLPLPAFFSFSPSFRAFFLPGETGTRRYTGAPKAATLPPRVRSLNREAPVRPAPTSMHSRAAATTGRCTSRVLLARRKWWDYWPAEAWRSRPAIGGGAPRCTGRAWRGTWERRKLFSTPGELPRTGSERGF